MFTFLYKIRYTVEQYIQSLFLFLTQITDSHVILSTTYTHMNCREACKRGQSIQHTPVSWL